MPGYLNLCSLLHTHLCVHLSTTFSSAGLSAVSDWPDPHLLLTQTSRDVRPPRSAAVPDDRASLRPGSQTQLQDLLSDEARAAFGQPRCVPAVCGSLADWAKLEHSLTETCVSLLMTLALGIAGAQPDNQRVQSSCSV